MVYRPVAVIDRFCGEAAGIRKPWTQSSRQVGQALRFSADSKRADQEREKGTVPSIALPQEF